MCSIAAVGVVSMGMQMVGGIMSASAQANGERANAKYYESLASTNEEQAVKIMDAAEIQQKYVVTSSAKETKKKREEFKRTIGSQKVVFASNGIGGGSVTAQDVAFDSLERSAEDEDLIRYNADVTATEIFRGSEFQADQLRTQAKHYRTAAKNTRAGIGANTAANLIGTGAQVGSRIIQLNSYQ
ncbi:MAG: hypothetical protein GY797_33380 [Deltaproteobacteria bacterium]|nr:hypothetical protein [Deltaproteobacteria bacterium]